MTRQCPPFYTLSTPKGLARDLRNGHLARSVQDSALLLEAHSILGITLLWLGELALAQEHVEQGLTLYNPQRHRSLAVLYGFDPGVFCLSLAACVLWLLGYPNQALQRSHEALALAQGLSHPFSLALALNFAAVLHQFRREGPIAQKRAEAAMTLSIEQGFPYWLAEGAIRRGWALAAQEQVEEGITQIRQGLASYQATGAEVLQSYYFALLGEAHGIMGQAEEALTVLTEALATVHKTGERFYEAELYRLEGELLLALSLDHQTEAETCFLQALTISRHQQAKSLELRAAVRLARLWQRQGKRQEARDLLAPVYTWFTEGFDTADLHEAQALLAALA